MCDSYRIEWLEPAKQDLRDIVFYLIDKAPLVAIGIQEEFDSQLSVLEKFPHISQENAYFDGVLDFKIKGLPYVVVYKDAPLKYWPCCMSGKIGLIPKTTGSDEDFLAHA